MRLFLGVELDGDVRAAAADAAGRLRTSLRRVAPALEARWIEPANLHLTLVFLGEVADDRAAAVQGALTQGALSVPRFDLAPAGVGAFPPAGAPRVFWIGVREGSGGMRALYDELTARLAPLGFERERRPYTAHLTIARVKDTGRAAPRAVRQVLADLPADCGRCEIAAVTLFRSRLSPRGAAYEPLLRVPLS